MRTHGIVRKGGFTIVEIMIVVAIVGLLASVAVPGFLRVKARVETNTCISNLRQIDNAKSVWAVERRVVTGTNVEWSDLIPDYIKRQPHCPAGGTYTIGVLGANPTCTVRGHVLPPVFRLNIKAQEAEILTDNTGG